MNGSTTGIFKSQLLRSQTDSHIVYCGLDEAEVPGSSFYITKEGGIDYEIVLLAIYHVFKRETNITSLRVLETGLNICELLIDFGVLKLGEHSHNLTMGILKRALLHLGCPHGCNEGVRGAQAEFLRLQCNSNLSRLLKQASSLSKKYLREMIRESSLHELIEFFHAFVGFCVDPSSLLSPLSKICYIFQNSHKDLMNSPSLPSKICLTNRFVLKLAELFSQKNLLSRKLFVHFSLRGGFDPRYTLF